MRVREPVSVDEVTVPLGASVIDPPAYVVTSHQPVCGSTSAGCEGPASSRILSIHAKASSMLTFSVWPRFVTSTELTSAIAPAFFSRCRLANSVACGASDMPSSCRPIRTYQ